MQFIKSSFVKSLNIYSNILKAKVLTFFKVQLCIFSVVRDLFNYYKLKIRFINMLFDIK